MHYVILRDDDTCAVTPPAALERLYRPFLDRGMPVHLATIPEVRTDVRGPDGQIEGFLTAGLPARARTATLASSPELMAYLARDPGYQLLLHGYHHDCFEFGAENGPALGRLLDQGLHRFHEAGFARPRTFVAPYDRFSRAAYLEVARRFPVISTGWFEARRLPRRWWPGFARKKVTGVPHWRAGGAVLLSHPGCLLSCHRPIEGMLPAVQRAVTGATLTVIVTHWWEYFRHGHANEPFIGALHAVAEWLASRPDIRVTTFAAVQAGSVPLV